MLRHFVFFLALIVVAATSTHAQPIVDIIEPEEYEIGGITVAGNAYTNENAIKNLSGLTVGQTIKIPGDDLREAIKKLWKLRLFTDINILQTKKIGQVVFLEIVVRERPRLARHSYSGVRKGEHDDLNKAIDKYLIKGSIITEGMKSDAQNAIEQHYINKGFLNAAATVMEFPDSLLNNSARLTFNIEKGSKIKIAEIQFNGVSKVKKAKLYKLLKKTKRAPAFFKQSKYVKATFEEEKEKVIQYYNTKGHRDALITRDTIYQITKANGKKALKIEMDINEGGTYYFGDIVFKGNSVYEEELLRRMLGIGKGDVYNSELLNNRLNFDQSGRDISSLYMDNGYLFFRVTPLETGVKNDSIDVEIRMVEGPLATIEEVNIYGNDRTHEHVIRRELRTRPGQKFSRQDVIRSQREIVNLNYFNPEKIGINTPVNPQKGTVNIDYTLEEKPSDQLELSAGWGGGGNGIIGTLGVSFNNFSLRNIGKPETWNPLPQGDGQRLSLRMQTNGRFFQSYTFSFTEPWLGGKRPTALSTSVSYIRQTNGLTPESSAFAELGILSSSLSLGTRLKWPDDYFISQTAINYQLYSLKNSSRFGSFTYPKGDGTEGVLPDGTYHGLTFEQTISRNSVLDPIFPREGSSISLSFKTTLPYSLFTSKDFRLLNPADKYNLLEYYKISLKADWYQPIVGKLVFKAATKMGYLGFYNSGIGTSPFERFRLGGDGIANFNGFQGFEIISSRGYTPEDYITGGTTNTPIYNKYTFELRYPVSLNPSSTIYVTSFFEASNAWKSFEDYDPLNLKRSAGMGLRVFLPMFGTLGFDYGIGFDKTISNNPNPSIWDLGRFNIVLGFEPQ